MDCIKSESNLPALSAIPILLHNPILYRNVGMVVELDMLVGMVVELDIPFMQIFQLRIKLKCSLTLLKLVNRRATCAVRV